MADSEDEEIISDERDFQNFYGGEDQKSDILNVKKAKDSSTLFPAQKCLTEALKERIEFILKLRFGHGLKYFKSFDFQVRRSYLIHIVLQLLIRLLRVSFPFFILLPFL